MLPKSLKGVAAKLVFLVQLCCLCACQGARVGERVANDNHSVNSVNDKSVSGGSCQYATFSGTAKVTEIVPEGSADTDAASDSIVRFDFARDRSRVEGFSPTFEHNPEYRIRVSQRELKEKQIRKGAEYHATMKEIRSGTCVPYSFEIDW